MTAGIDIVSLEERAFNAWPAFQSVLAGGWLFRFAEGYTKRANSVNAIAPSGDFADILLLAENLYVRRGLPVVFRLSPLAPAEADETLQQAGYALVEPSQVMTAGLSSDAGEGDRRVTIEHGPSALWLAGTARASGLSSDHMQSHARLVGSIPPTTGFATMREDGEAIGFGMAVVDRGAVGLFDLVVARDHRGRGLGRALVDALLRWGARRGAVEAYLQVHAGNSVATGLYCSLGFRTAYGYHYRVRQLSPT